MDTDALRRLHYVAAVACGMIAALAVHIVLTVFGVGLDSVLRDAAAASKQQFASALAWWAIGGADEAGAPDRPPSQGRRELLLAGGRRIAQHRIQADAEHGQHDVHGERRDHSAGDGGDIVQAAEGVGVHAVRKRLWRRGGRCHTIADAFAQREARRALPRAAVARSGDREIAAPARRAAPVSASSPRYDSAATETHPTGTFDSR